MYGVKGPVNFLAKGKNMHIRLSGGGLWINMYWHKVPMLKQKIVYMDDDIWEKVVNIKDPEIRNM